MKELTDFTAVLQGPAHGSPMLSCSLPDLTLHECIAQEQERVTPIWKSLLNKKLRQYLRKEPIKLRPKRDTQQFPRAPCYCSVGFSWFSKWVLCLILHRLQAEPNFPGFPSCPMQKSDVVSAPARCRLKGKSLSAADEIALMLGPRQVFKNSTAGSPELLWMAALEPL